MPSDVFQTFLPAQRVPMVALPEGLIPSGVPQVANNLSVPGVGGRNSLALMRLAQQAEYQRLREEALRQNIELKSHGTGKVAEQYADQKAFDDAMLRLVTTPGLKAEYQQIMQQPAKIRIEKLKALEDKYMKPLAARVKNPTVNSRDMFNALLGGDVAAAEQEHKDKTSDSIEAILPNLAKGARALWGNVEYLWRDPRDIARDIEAFNAEQDAKTTYGQYQRELANAGASLWKRTEGPSGWLNFVAENALPVASYFIPVGLAGRAGLGAVKAARIGAGAGAYLAESSGDINYAGRVNQAPISEEAKQKAMTSPGRALNSLVNAFTGAIAPNYAGFARRVPGLGWSASVVDRASGVHPRLGGALNSALGMAALTTGQVPAGNLGYQIGTGVNTPLFAGYQDALTAAALTGAALGSFMPRPRPLTERDLNYTPEHTLNQWNRTLRERDAEYQRQQAAENEALLREGLAARANDRTFTERRAEAERLYREMNNEDRQILDELNTPPERRQEIQRRRQEIQQAIDEYRARIDARRQQFLEDLMDEGQRNQQWREMLFGTDEPSADPNVSLLRTQEVVANQLAQGTRDYQRQLQENVANQLAQGTREYQDIVNQQWRNTLFGTDEPYADPNASLLRNQENIANQLAQGAREYQPIKAMRNRADEILARTQVNAEVNTPQAKIQRMETIQDLLGNNNNPTFVDIWPLLTKEWSPEIQDNFYAAFTGNDLPYPDQPWIGPIDPSHVYSNFEYVPKDVIKAQRYNQVHDFFNITQGVIQDGNPNVRNAPKKVNLSFWPPEVRKNFTDAWQGEDLTYPDKPYIYIPKARSNSRKWREAEEAIKRTQKYIDELKANNGRQNATPAQSQGATRTPNGSNQTTGGVAPDTSGNAGTVTTSNLEVNPTNSPTNPSTGLGGEQTSQLGTDAANSTTPSEQGLDGGQQITGRTGNTPTGDESTLTSTGIASPSANGGEGNANEPIPLSPNFRPTGDINTDINSLTAYNPVYADANRMNLTKAVLDANNVYTPSTKAQIIETTINQSFAHAFPNLKITNRKLNQLVVPDVPFEDILDYYNLISPNKIRLEDFTKYKNLGSVPKQLLNDIINTIREYNPLYSSNNGTTLAC